MSLTAAIIIELALKKILETSAGELSKKFTVGAIAKMDELRQMIQDKFTGNSRAETAINAIRQSLALRDRGWFNFRNSPSGSLSRRSHAR